MKEQIYSIGNNVEWLPRKSSTVIVEKGCLWISNKEGKDILLSAGESAELGKGPCLVQGLEGENNFRTR